MNRSPREYRNFVEVTRHPALARDLISDDITFDAWFYIETVPSAGFEPMMKGRFRYMGRAARGFAFAVYDEDTGLFIFFDRFG